MVKKLIVTLLVLACFSLPLNNTRAQNTDCVEIFDAKQGKVIKTVELNSEIQTMVADWVATIDSIYAKLDINTNDGYVVRIPLDPAVNVRCDYLNATVTEVYIAIPERDPPYYAILGNDNKLSCYQFNGDVNTLSMVLGFELSPSQQTH